MVDFRKWLIALAAVALVFALGTPANAQQGIGAPFVCTASAADPHIDRVEGITELTGDITLQCSGGIPTPAGKIIPQTNVTLTLNTNITSRLLGSGYIDALLAIDEPVTTPASAQNPPVSQVPQPVTAPPQSVCFSNNSGQFPGNPQCNVELGTYNGIAPGLPGSAASPYQTQPNIFVAQQTAANQVAWLGIPIDAPGTVLGRTIRLTNVRGNACQLGLSSTLIPTQIVAFISVNGSANLQINNPQQTVAFIQQGLIVGSTPGNNITQCNNLNVGGGGNGGNFFGGAVAGQAEFAINLREGFAASFKRHMVPALGVTSIGPNGVVEGTQNVIGFNYNNEAGWDPTGTNPSGIHFGQADTATRFLIRLNNINTGVRILVPVIVPLTTNNGALFGAPLVPSSGLGAFTGGFIRLVGGTSDANGNLPVNTAGFVSATTSFTGNGDPAFGNFGAPFKGPGDIAPWNGAAELTGTGGTIFMVYEVVNEDPSAVEQANIPFGVAFVSNTAQNLPAPGISTFNASFAPLSTTGTASSSAPIPRFCDQSVARTGFAIIVCQCNLLFPFVTNQAGFDTGIALANTTVDPYGTTPQNGTVGVFYFGNTAGGGAAPTKQTTQVVPAGQELIFNLSGGGNFGMQATPGFQGYIITIANFQFCHAFAFISDVGSQRLAEGYLAIQLDVPGLNRTGILGENEGH
jgi:hypothetical protein